MLVLIGFCAYTQYSTSCGSGSREHGHQNMSRFCWIPLALEPAAGTRARNHGIKEHQAGRDHEEQLVQPFLAKHGLDELAQHPVQLHLKSV